MGNTFAYISDAGLVIHRDVYRFSDVRVHERVVVPNDVSLVRLEGGLWQALAA